MASEAVGSGSIPDGTTTLKMQGNPYKIKDFSQNLRFVKQVAESHSEAQNGIKILQNLLPYATQMQTACINGWVPIERLKVAFCPMELA
jgi:hypothetical protein